MTIRPTISSDEEALIDTIILAFSSDPVWRWCWPEAHAYLQHSARFIRAFAGNAFTNEGAYCSDDHAAVCLWLRPNVQSDEVTLGEIMQTTMSDTVRTDLYGVLEQMATYRPTGPHWYLPIIGVDPSRQGAGYGSALMNYALQECDREHLPAYLESTNARNVPLYRRHGFEVVGKIQSGDSPMFLPMYRSPR